MATMTRSVYEELGVRSVINARGHQTVLGGATPSPRVKAAMEQADRYYVDMQQLLQRSGAIIAGLLRVEAAYVTPGAAAALALGTAACVTGNDLGAMARLPDTSGLKQQVVIQKAQRYKYERATTIVGTRLVEAGGAEGTTAEQLAAALGPYAATVLYPAHLEGQPGALSLQTVLDVAHRRGVPVLVDAASQVYPLERFAGFGRMGVDLVCFGAKYIGAPHSSGILAGRKDLVEAAARQGFIGFETTGEQKVIGRPFKLDRQEIVAVVAALQEWMATDHDRRLANLERVLQTIAGPLEGLRGVRLEHVRGSGASPRLLRVTIDPSVAPRTADAVVRGLWEGEPAIAVGTAPGALLINPVTIFPGDEAIVSERLRALLS